MPDGSWPWMCPRTVSGHRNGRGAGLLEVSRFGGWRLEVVVKAVDKDHGRGNELGELYAVEAGDVDRVERFTTRLVGERPQPATLAESVPDRLAAELVLTELGLAREKPEGVSLDRR